MKRIAIVTTHPIQYNAPWFRLLNEEPDIQVRVFYTWHIGAESKPDEGFGKSISWDIPLLEGYEYELVKPSRNVQQRTFRNMDSPGLTERIKRWKPDVVLVFGHNFRSHLRTMRDFKGRVPVWFRGDSTLLNEKPGLKRIVRRQVLRRVYRSVDLALAVGQNNRDYFLKHGLSREQIIFVPHAIDNHRFGEHQHDRSAEVNRLALGFQDDEVVVLFAGKIESKKSPIDLAEAFQIASRARNDLRLLFVGDGPLKPDVVSTVAGDDRVRFLAFQNQSQMPAAYRIGDITCLPSRFETWGLCLNESMASGRAIIASDRVGASIDVVKESTGFSYGSGNVSELAQILAELPGRSELHSKGAHCQQTIQDWSLERIVQTVAEQLRSLGDKADGQ